MEHRTEDRVRYIVERSMGGRWDVNQDGFDEPIASFEERADALEWMRMELIEERETRALYRRWQEQGYGRSLWWRCRRKLGVKVTRKGTQTDQQTYLFIPPPV